MSKGKDAPCEWRVGCPPGIVPAACSLGSHASQLCQPTRRPARTAAAALITVATSGGGCDAVGAGRRNGALPSSGRSPLSSGPWPLMWSSAKSSNRPKRKDTRVAPHDWPSYERDDGLPAGSVPLMLRPTQEAGEE
eukprot:scaffold7390_cov100-Isochrysis_galbana.AAC.3